VSAVALSLWLDEPYAGRAPLDGDRRCEVCVVGAGVGGIAVARRLAARGVDVLVVERRTVAGGASGRNGGFFIAGAAPAYDEAVRRFGRERARRIHAATLAAQVDMLAVADAVGARDAFRRVGLLRVGVDAAESEAVRSHHAALRADGFPGELVGGDALPAALRRDGRVGLLTPHDGGVHPVRWLRALARDLPVVEATRVLEPPRREGASVVVATDRGTVRADRAVVAVDGGLGALVPSARDVRARRLQMLATAPVAAEVLPCPIYMRDGHEYAQQLPDGRIALGGFSDLDGSASYTDREEVSTPVQTRLERYLREELGLAAPQVTHRWAGVVGYADEPMPRCGPVPGSAGRVLALGAYNGTGLVQGWVAARIVAELLLDGASADADLYAGV
jgi:gamma-glutamylputrescine oxidase